MKKNTVIKNKLNYLLITVAILICNFNLELQGATPSGAKMVDLGLPSGTLWANMNVGATKQEQYGSYFAWGEIASKPDNYYTIEIYKHYYSNEREKVKKYCTISSQGTVDNLTKLSTADDAAYQNWDSSWRMPTTTQYQELIDNCTMVWTTVNGVKGAKVTGPNGNYIFLPAGGYKNYGQHLNEGEVFDSWTLNLNTDENHHAYQANANENHLYMNSGGGRPFGRSVRPVSVRKGLRLDVSKVTLRPYQTRLLVLSTKDTDAKALSTAKWTSSNTSVATVTQDGWVEAKANGTATITVTNTYGLSITCKVTVADPAAPSGVKLVDLGLPSGTLWANMNVGASKQEQFGSYFAWGETTPKATYSWSNYRFGTKYALTRYNMKAETGTVDNYTVLMGKDDAAYVSWGSDWRMPTQKQYQELIDNCTLESTTVNGVNGFKIKGPSGNWIFFPATGYYTSDGFANETRFLSWTRTLNAEECYCAYQANASDVQIYMNGDGGRSAARVVRPVAVKLALRLDVTKLTMNPYQVRQLHLSTKDADETVLSTAKWTSSDAAIVKVDANGWVTAVANGSATITVTNSYGATATCKITVKDPSAPKEVELVDLGLPSCTLWANMNVGATKPEESGSFFAWGETSTKTDYLWTNYRFGTSSKLTRYNVNTATGTVDNYTVLMGKDDAAYVQWGSDWRMATKEQYQELIDNCTVEEISVNGKSGFKIIGPSGNSIFLPSTGYITSEGLKNEANYISWTRSLETDNCNAAFQANASKGTMYYSDGSRAAGRVIRPVSSSTKAVRIKTLSFAEGEIALVVGRTKVIKPIVSPFNATAQIFDWSSSNTEIVEVDSEGNIIGINTGHATITIKAKENPQITASFEVDVVLLGDANNDGEVDIVDVVIVYNYLNNEDAGNIVLEACDMNNDNSVSSNDVSLLIDKILDKEIDNNLPNDIEDEAH